MPQSFKCPSCGAPLPINGRDAHARCHFCGNSVIVPEDLRSAAAPPYQHQHQQPSAPVMGNILGQAEKLGELGRLVRAGNKLEAIKLYRQLFGTNLRDAKEAVERLEAGKSVEVMNVSDGGYNNVQIDPAQFPAAAPAAFHHARTQRSLRGPLLLILFFVVFVGLAIALVTLFAISRARQSVGSISLSPSTADPKQKGGQAAPSGIARVALEFGSEGIGAGQFKDARSIGVDGEGRIYVAEYIGGRVQVFDGGGKFLAQWMVDQKMPLRGMAVDRKGTVYIVQKGEITRYEGMTGKTLGSLSYNSYRGGNNFDDVTVTQEGGLVAAARGNADDIVRFDASGKAIQTIPAAISGQTDRSELNMRVATDGLGNIYALGSFNNAVFKFTREGKFVTRVGGEGNEPGQFRALGAIAVDGQGRIFVSDTKGIQVFDTNGRYIDVFKVDGGYPSALVFNDRNELFVAARTKVVKLVIK